MTASDARASIWRKSRHSLGNGNCVQVAASSNTVMVRDSTDSTSLVISYPAKTWSAFVAAAKISNYFFQQHENRSLTVQVAQLYGRAQT